MCNDYEQHVTQQQYQQAIKALELDSTGAAAELPQADDIRIGDMGPVLRAAGNGVELVSMRFGWPPPRPKAPPVFNFKSDGRHFDKSKRCLVILSGFFEFTGSKSPKTKHRFSVKGSPIMAIAGLWSEDADGALSFTMLTTEPGPDIAPIHDRQVCVILPEDWAHWLFLTKPEEELLRPLPAGTLDVVTVRP
ncbi:MAG TPA: SOS response-associated peptidase [Devosia sp.]|jgi:putative SOS response-associated peptidase YedK|uniref:SOS response-associated peptidase n=1 Tax=Devosia sp. TaxID=1871048 RepID=UPI002DDC9984|nr:SOS response-associated peptidase [Devosia sp.]HEV2516627.1 SOS response-associated peptidase [Devosia sp.]